MILWFTGISGVGKTLIAKNIYKILSKRKKNLVHVDGDVFRKMLGNDLGYTLKDRNKNAERIINFVGYGIKNFKSDTASLKLINNGSKRDFLKNCYKLIKIFKQK